MAIEIVDFPIKNGGSFHSFLYVYQRVIIRKSLMIYLVTDDLPIKVVIFHKFNHQRVRMLRTS